MLTASYPIAGWKGWAVSSKSHITPDPTVITVWGIGMKIEGLTRNQLISNLIMQPLPSAPSSHNDFGVNLTNRDYALLGGGFKIGEQPQQPNSANIATGSFLDNSFGWRARSKDMDIVTPLPIRVFVIGIKRTIMQPSNPDKAFGYIDVTFNSQETLPNKAHPVSTAPVIGGYALCGGGAVTHFSYWGGGSYLWALEPVTEITEDPLKQTFTGRAKDHHHEDPATITAYAMGVKLFPAAQA